MARDLHDKKHPSISSVDGSGQAAAGQMLRLLCCSPHRGVTGQPLGQALHPTSENTSAHPLCSGTATPQAGRVSACPLLSKDLDGQPLFSVSHSDPPRARSTQHPAPAVQGPQGHFHFSAQRGPLRGCGLFPHRSLEGLLGWA